MRVQFLFFCVLLLIPAAARAQFDSGTVVGTVRDASGAVVPAAKVKLTSVATGIDRRQLQLGIKLLCEGSRWPCC